MREKATLEFRHSDQTKQVLQESQKQTKEHDLPVMTTSKYSSQPKSELPSTTPDPQRKFITVFV